MSDFLRNHKAHVARLKATHAPEVLTVNGKAELVVLDAESYQDLTDRLRNLEAADRLREDLARYRTNTSASEAPSKDEIERRHRVLDDLVEETERLGLYK
jgi:PHD/YefM family antitoxin component YafN of YafNO toxin-antitoxin module